MIRSIGACSCLALGLGIAAACGTSSTAPLTSPPPGDGGSSSGGSSSGSSSGSGSGGTPGSPDASSSGGGSDAGGGDCSSCPTGFSCAAGSSVCKSAAGVPAFGNVYLLVEENHSYATVMGATYIASLIASNASASNYKDTLVHPSLPNYLGLASGGNHGVTCDCQAGSANNKCGACNDPLTGSGCDCTQPATVTSIADELEAKSLSWHAYGEDMNTPGCDNTNHGSYVARHVPLLYFDAVRTSAARCANVVPFTGFGMDVGKYAFSFVTPNLCNDGHDTCAPVNDPVKQTDAWLSTNVPVITGATSFKKNGVLFITWDEGDEPPFAPVDDHVLLLVISPFAKQTVTAVAYNHYSLLGTIEEGLGLPSPHLGTAPINDIWK